MTRSLFTQHTISRSPLDGRSKPSAVVIQNGGVDRTMRSIGDLPPAKVLENDCSKCIQHSRLRVRGNVNLTRWHSFPIA